MTILTRDQIRAQILGSESLKRKSITLTFCGTQIELRQPTAGDMIRFQETQRTQGLNMVDVLLEFAYVPGTDEKVFDVADVDVLKQLPFNAEARLLIEAIENFTNMVVGDAEKNSPETTSSGT